MKNADAIRKMTNRELTELLLDFKCTHCDFNGFCGERGRCKKEISAWLKEEREEPRDQQ